VERRGVDALEAHVVATSDNIDNIGKQKNVCYCVIILKQK